MVGERKKTTVDGIHGLCGMLVFVPDVVRWGIPAVGAKPTDFARLSEPFRLGEGINTWPSSPTLLPSSSMIYLFLHEHWEQDLARLAYMESA